jgi:LacI family transcriptional regulator
VYEISILRSGEPFTAAFIASDNVAIGAKAALREANLHMPDDISLVGFDDIPWANIPTRRLRPYNFPLKLLHKAPAFCCWT